MLTTPFLTDLDSRAAVKGSRDPLGIQQIWTRLGRHVVGNLTTVSNSVRDFTTLLLGYYFAEQLSNDLGPGTDLETFLKWEQLAAYSRAEVNGDFAFRGTEKVRKNLSEGPRVFLSDERGHQILGNQKIYGLWGLYTMPSRASALVDGDPSRLTPPAMELIERHYLPILEQGTGKDARRIRELLRQKRSRIDVRQTHSDIVACVGKVLQRRLLQREKEFYRFHLLYGGPDDATDGRQQQLAELLSPSLSDKNFTWSPAAVEDLSKSALSRGDEWHQLAHRLQRIRASETVLAPTAALFTHLLGLDGKSISTVVDRIGSEWGQKVRSVFLQDFRELHAELGAGDTTTADRWVEIADALAGGEYRGLVRLLIEQNASVMATRGGAPWIELDSGKLRVRFRDEQGTLPKQATLGLLWRFPYFLDSLRTVAFSLKEKQSV
jgi:hypothetical protein